MKHSLQRLALAILAVLAISGMALAQTYPQVRISDVVTPVDPNYGTSGDTHPHHIGDTVTVVGRVIFKSGISSGTPAGGRDIWIVDTASTANGRLFGGIEVFPDTAGSSGGGPGNANFPQNLNYGDIIAVTGRVFVYPTSITGPGSVFTELVPPNIGASSVQFIAPGSGVKSDASDQPFVVTIDSLKKKVNNVVQNNFAVGQKYEANWLEIRNAYVSSRTGSPGSAWTWALTDATSGNTISIQSRSSKIYGPSTPTFAPPPLGQRLNYIRGVLTKANSSTVVNGIAGGNNYVFEPIDSTDWQVGTGVVALPPSVTITTGGRTTAFGTSSSSVPLTFKVVRGLNGGTNSNVQIYYAVTAPGASTGFFGPYTALPATPTGGDSLWTATLPAAANGSYVNYFVQATNDSGKTVFSPADTSQGKYFYKVIDNGKPAIQDIQFSPYANNASPVAGFSGITITGSVTVNRADSLGSQRQVTSNNQQTYNTKLSFYIQDSSKVWSGIEIYQKPSDTTNYARGTSLTITGTVKENSNTSTYIDTTYTVVNNGPGTLWAPIDIPNTSTFASNSEPFESVLVRLLNVTVTDSNSDGLSKFGDFNVATTGNSGAAKVRVSVCANAQYIGARLPLAVPPQVRVNVGNKFDAIWGIGYQSFGTYKVNPRKSGDFINANLSAGETALGKASSFALSQNYPNPFNPATTIRYDVAVRGLVTLKVYDILGREVSTLVNQVRDAGAYEVSFNAARFASGIYFYRLQAGSFVQTKKMVLVK
jgi:hypothetical protein